MKVAVLGGAGLMGAGIVRDLVSKQSEGVQRVYVADIDLDKMQDTFKMLNDERIELLRLDVSDPMKTKELLSKVDICINSVPTFAGFQMDIFNYCHEIGCDYIDLGGMGIYTPRQKAQHGNWIKSGNTAVLGTGADPGMSNVLCKAVAEKLDTIDKISLYWAAKLIGPDNPVLVPPYNIATVIAEYANSSKQFIDGQLIDMPPQSGKQTLVLPEPFGETEFMHSQHSETLTVPFAKGIKEKGIKEFTWRLHLPDNEDIVYKSLVKTGFSDTTEIIKVNDVEIKSIDVLKEVINQNIEKNIDKIPEQESYEIHISVGEGFKDGKKIGVTYTVFSKPDPFYDGYNDAATSMNVSIAAQLLFRNRKNPGVWGPEEYFNVDEYFQELKKRHFNISYKTQTEEHI